MRRLRRTIVAPLLLSLLLLGACRVDPEIQTVDGQAGLLFRAADATAGAGTARFETVTRFEFTDASGDPADSFETRIEGEIDLPNGRMYSFTTVDGVENSETIVDGDVLYLRSPIFSLLSADQGTWIRVDASAFGLPAASMTGSAAGFDLRSQIDLLRGVAGEIDDLGEAEIRGVPAAHYRAVIDVASAFEQIPADQQQWYDTQWGDYGDLAGLMTDTFGETITVDVWIDSENLLRRMEMRLAFGGFGDLLSANDDGAIVIEAEYWDYGAPLSIEAPNPDDVTDILDLQLADPDPFDEGAYFDSFGAPCMGSDMVNCLEAPAALKAPNVDANACDGSGKRVCIVPMGAVPPEMIENIVTHFAETYGLTIHVAPALDIPESLMDPERRQFETSDLIDHAYTSYWDLELDRDVTILAITAVDVFMRHRPEWGWCFGTRFEDVELIEQGVEDTFRYGTISVARMNPLVYGEPEDTDLWFTRARKFAIKYVGVLHYNFPTNNDRTSVLYDLIGGLSTLDSVGEELPPLPDWASDGR